MSHKNDVYERSNRDFYDQDSRTYDKQRWHSKGGVFTNAIQQHILTELSADWGKSRTLEVGCGTGRFSISLLKRGAILTLADISPHMLEIARRNIAAEHLTDGVEAYANCSIYELPFESNSFDHVIALNVLNHVERPLDAISELSRVTRTGSTVLFNYANVHSFYWPAAMLVNKNRRAVGLDVYSYWQRPGDIAHSIREAKLELIKVLGHTHMPRALEPYPMLWAVRFLDHFSRRGLLRKLAPIQFCLCRKRDPESAA